MRKISCLFIAFVLMSCATPEQKAEKIELTIDIEQAAPQVTLVLPGTRNWCEAEAKCEYLRNLKCGTALEETCKKHFQLDAVRLGGDTVVVQSFQEYYGQKGKVYSYAQVYRCSGKFNQLGQRYQALNPTRLSKVKYLSKDYAKQCGIVKQCKAVEPFQCTNFDWYPARRCLGTLARQYTDDGPANVLVFEDEKFTELEDNGKYQKGDYVVRGSTYHCPSN